jgi:hypothetical protein
MNNINHEIRFVNVRNKTLFFIPDGGYIKISYSDGEIYFRKCIYVDDYHLDVDGYLYHILEFAQKIDQCNCKVEACNSPDTILNFLVYNKRVAGDSLVVLTRINDQKDRLWTVLLKKTGKTNFDIIYHGGSKRDAHAYYMGCN